MADGHSKADRYKRFAVFADPERNFRAMTDQARRAGDILSAEDAANFIRVANERAALMEKLREAVLANDPLKTMEVARELCGVEEEETQH